MVRYIQLGAQPACRRRDAGAGAAEPGPRGSAGPGRGAAAGRLDQPLPGRTRHGGTELPRPGSWLGDGLTVAASRPVGAVWLLDGLWRALDVDAALRKVLGARRFTTDVERVLFALVANRAIEPKSKLSAAEWAGYDVAIDGLAAMDEDQAYRAMDLLVEADAQAEVQEAVFFAVADLLNLEVDLLFFDTTSTYFERDTEEAGEDAFRVYGHSKDHRNDLPQIVIGLAVTKEGIPVRVWCWPGNTNDAALLPQVERRPGLAARAGHHRGGPWLLLRRQPGLPAPRRRALHRRDADARRKPVDRHGVVPPGTLPAGPRQPAGQRGQRRRHRGAVRHLPQPRAGRTRPHPARGRRHPPADRAGPDREARQRGEQQEPHRQTQGRGRAHEGRVRVARSPRTRPLAAPAGQPAAS